MGNKRIPLEPDKMYHVYNHANGSECLFRSEENYHYFLKKYAQYIHPVAETFAYCLMPNHFHLLIRIRPAAELLKLTKNPPGFENLAGLVSRQFSHFFNAYAKAFNKQYNRRGGLFIDDAQRKLIDREDYYTKLIQYIHGNPVHHGFVPHPADWRHSSYNALVSTKNTLLPRLEILDWFGGLSAFRQFHEQNLDKVIFTDLKF